MQSTIRFFFFFKYQTGKYVKKKILIEGRGRQKFMYNGALIGMPFVVGVLIIFIQMGIINSIISPLGMLSFRNIYV